MPVIAVESQVELDVLKKSLEAAAAGTGMPRGWDAVNAFQAEEFGKELKKVKAAPARPRARGAARPCFLQIHAKEALELLPSDLGGGFKKLEKRPQMGKVSALLSSRRPSFCERGVGAWRPSCTRQRGLGGKRGKGGGGSLCQMSEALEAARREARERSARLEEASKLLEAGG